MATEAGCDERPQGGSELSVAPTAARRAAAASVKRGHGKRPKPARLTCGRAIFDVVTQYFRVRWRAVEQGIVSLQEG